MVIKKFNQSGIGSKNSCKYELMSNACIPILVGIPSFVSEILILLKTAKISLSDHGLWSMVVEKFNRLELAQRVHASRGRC